MAPGVSQELCRGCEDGGQAGSPGPWEQMDGSLWGKQRSCPPEWRNLQPVRIKWNFLRGVFRGRFLLPCLPPVPLRLVWLSVGPGLWQVVQGYRCLSRVGQGPLASFAGSPPNPPSRLHLSLSPQGEGLHQLREALKILAERVLILETMIGLYGE